MRKKNLKWFGKNKSSRQMANWPRIDPTKVGHFQKIKVLKFDNIKIYSMFPTDYLVFYVWDFEKNGSILGWSAICLELFFPNNFKKIVFMLMKNYSAVVHGSGQKLNGSSTVTYRLMAWTRKSPIRGNFWVPLSWRALLCSVR